MQLLGECSWVAYVASVMTGKFHNGDSWPLRQQGSNPVRKVPSRSLSGGNHNPGWRGREQRNQRPRGFAVSETRKIVDASQPSVPVTEPASRRGISPSEAWIAPHLGLEAATNYTEMRLLVGIYMTAFRVAVAVWLEHEAQGDLVSLLREYLDYCSSLSRAV